MIFFLLSLFPPFHEAEEFGFGDISRFAKPFFSVTYQSLFSLPELQSVKIALNNERYGGLISHFGTDLYREMMLGGRYKLELENLYLIVTPSLLYLNQVGEENFGFNTDLRAGVFYNQYHIFLNAIHPVSYIRGGTIPVELELCILYENQWSTIGLKVNFLEGWGTGLGFGYTLKFPNFQAGLGLLTNPMIPTAGFIVDVGNICFSSGFQNHPDLGLSNTFTVNYRR